MMDCFKYEKENPCPLFYICHYDKRIRELEEELEHLRGVNKQLTDSGISQHNELQKLRELYPQYREQNKEDIETITKLKGTLFRIKKICNTSYKWYDFDTMLKIIDLIDEVVYSK